jgi:hypothetical protein
MNVIFGSGIVGLLAKLILGPSWTVVPFYRSRFFSFNPALDDNFIIHDDEIEPFIKELTSDIKPQMFPYRRAWSVQGHLLDQWDDGLCRDWLFKIFGTNPPPQSELYYRNRMTLHVYDIRLNEIYQSLVNQYMPDLQAEAAKGQVTEVGDHYFIRDGVRNDFERAISTIPLNALCQLMKSDVNLPSKTVHYLHIRTKDLDFEGFNQTFVVDQMFSFFKAANIAPERYMIYCHEDIPNPGVYFMSFIPTFEIIDGTSIENAIPMGPMPNLSAVEKAGITCVGSYAQWDWCADVGSNILRLIRYANRGNKPIDGLRPVTLD